MEEVLSSEASNHNILDDYCDDEKKKKKLFPFTTIIVTNPDHASANAAQHLLDTTLKNHINALYPNQDTDKIKFLSTYDPYGARCGSFGGTLAAIDLLLEDTDCSLEDETILCLHAGGDSSRCPLSMILGKAWQDLPSKKYRNPTFWLIHQLELLYTISSIPKGSLIVAATDCLISLGTTKADRLIHDEIQNLGQTDAMDPSTVLGVAVPAPLSTAKNHGVFVLPNEFVENQQSSSSSPTTRFHVLDPIDVWQKPSISRMTETPGATFDLPEQRSENRQAWIDVGIVIFFPQAFYTLMKLSTGLCSMCTRKGIKEAYNKEQQQQSKSSTFISLEQYAKRNALKVDLYTDLLHNMPWANKGNDTTSVNGESTTTYNNKDTFNVSLQQILSKLSLKVLIVPEGSFLHLGTTLELIEFITCGSYYTEESNPSSIDKEVTKNLGNALRLCPRFKTYQDPLVDSYNQNVTLCSTFPVNKNTKLGTSTFVEYSDLDYCSSVSIGDNCMLSGWRNTNQQDVPMECHFKIPNDLSIQMLCLKRDSDAITNDRQVLVVLGTKDSIKSCLVHSTIYSIPFKQLRDTLGMSGFELGLSEILDENDCLWRAKIHPVLNVRNSPSSFGSMFAWIEKLRAEDDDVREDPSFKRWLLADRVSLKDLHDLSDAAEEWSYRKSLEAKLWNLQSKEEIQQIVSLLEKRCQNIPCNLQWLAGIEDKTKAGESLCTLMRSLEDVALEALKRSNFDVSGRALMLASAALADFDINHNNEDSNGTADNVGRQCKNLLENLKFTSTRAKSSDYFCRSVGDIITLLRSLMNQFPMGSAPVCSDILEQLALWMTEVTIVSGFQRFLDSSNSESISIFRARPPIQSSWVISIAPVRVDLAGGWSDTPPICYEYGGSVTGMAVLIDNYYPLSCRCRLLPGKQGILLKSEIRDMTTGSLLSFHEDKISSISQMDGFRDPSAVCALLKACLIGLGMLSEEQIHHNKEDIQLLISQFCSTTENVRMEIITTSLLGMGTGMGTSSILAACILQAIAYCVGIGKLEDEFLLHAVLMVEQLLSSGGGWQDQAHGISPGVKTIRSMPPRIPLQITFEPLEVPARAISAFEERLLFAYTGQTRLAKNILQQVLRRWSRRTKEIVQTVHALVETSENLRNAFLEESWDKVAAFMYKSYHLKCIMAGESSGAEPKPVKTLISKLKEAKLISGAMLCGAGGGGFLLLLLSEDVNRKMIEEFFETEIVQFDEGMIDFTFHDCHIAQRGLTTRILNDEAIDNDSFDLAWQSRMQHSPCEEVKS